MPSPDCYRGQTKDISMLWSSDRVIFLIQMDFSIILFCILITIFLILDEKLRFHENRNIAFIHISLVFIKKKDETKIQPLTTEN